MNESTSDPGNQEGIRDSELDSVIEGSFGSFQHGVQLGCLGDSSWETIKDESEISHSPVAWFMNSKKEEEKGEERVGMKRETQLSLLLEKTYPSLHSWLDANSSLIMPTIISSDTRSPRSIIFFASLPN